MIDAPPASAGASAPARGGERRAPARSLKAQRTRRRLAVCGVVFAVAVGFLLYKGLTSAFVYFKTASQAVADRASLGDSSFQIEGTVVPCTIRKLGPTSYAFSIASGSTRVAVRDSVDPPSLFQPNVPVVLQGHFVGSTDLFASDQILIKHSNQYVAAHPGRLATREPAERLPAGLRHVIDGALGDAGILVALCASVAGAAAVAAGLARRNAAWLASARRLRPRRARRGALVDGGDRARPRHPRLPPRLRRGQQLHPDAARVLGDGDVVGPAGLDPVVGPGAGLLPRARRLALPAAGERPTDRLGDARAARRSAPSSSR